MTLISVKSSSFRTKSHNNNVVSLQLNNLYWIIAPSVEKIGGATFSVFDDILI